METKQLKALFDQEYGADAKPSYCFFAPGRVNLIGEYTDFNGGYVFPAALSLGIFAVLRLREDHTIRLRSTNEVLPVTVSLDRAIEYTKEDEWANYPKGVIRYLREKGYSLQGCDILYAGTLPDGAGLSSSAAILVLTAYMLRSVNGDNSIERVQLAKFCQQVENQFIKVNCGIMDPFSVAMGEKDHAVLLDCHNLTYRYVPLDLPDYRLVILNTCKKRELTDSRYNERRRECETALALLAGHRAVSNLCQAGLKEVEAYITDDTLLRRARHVVSENSRVLEAVNLLESGDIQGFGRLLIQSHMSLKQDFEVSGPELDAIVESALRFPGCIGARMTGAGFGGCALALVEKTRLEAFCSFVTQEYTQMIGLAPEFYVSSLGGGVTHLPD